MTAREISHKLGIHKRTVSQIADKFNFSVDKTIYHAPKYKIDDIKCGIVSGEGSNRTKIKLLEESGTKIYDKYWKLHWEEFMVGCDTHSPFTNEKLFNRMLEVALHYKVKHFIHAGDFFDQLAWSQFELSQGDMVKFEDELEYSKKIVDSLLAVFEDVYFFVGSHDLRFWRVSMMLGKEQNYDTPFKLLDRPQIKTNNYRYAQVGSEWHITHPRNVVKLGTINSERLSAKHGRSVIFAHGHTWGHTMDTSGKHHIIASGGFFDTKKIAYKSLWDTSYPQWVGGFTMIVEKVRPILFGEHTPWGIYLK